MKFQTLGLVFALVGVGFSVVWVLLLRSGVRTLKGLREDIASERKRRVGRGSADDPNAD